MENREEEENIVLPAEIRRKHGLEPRDTFTLIDVDGVLALYKRFKSEGGSRLIALI